MIRMVNAAFLSTTTFICQVFQKPRTHTFVLLLLLLLDTDFGIFWYSFNYGNIHIIMMSTEHDYTPGSKQYKWLEQDLKSVSIVNCSFHTHTHTHTHTTTYIHSL